MPDFYEETARRVQAELPELNELQVGQLVREAMALRPPILAGRIGTPGVAMAPAWARQAVRLYKEGKIGKLSQQPDLAGEEGLVPGTPAQYAARARTTARTTAAARTGFDPFTTVPTNVREAHKVAAEFRSAWGGYYESPLTNILTDSSTGEPVPPAEAATYKQFLRMQELAFAIIKMGNETDAMLALEEVRSGFALQVAQLREAGEFERAAAERAMAGKNLDEAIRHNKSLEAIEGRRQDAEDKRFRAQLLLSLASDPLLLRLARDTPLVRLLAEGLGINIEQLSQLGGGQAPGAPTTAIRKEVR